MGDQTGRRRVAMWVIAYGVALLLIAFWPQPVDSALGGLVRWLVDAIPLMTYGRLEFASNVLLFVPFGVGFGMLLPDHRYLILPLALLVSMTIESGQALLLAARTPSLYDILANVAGACLGLVLLVGVQEWRRRRSRRQHPDRGV